MDKNFGLVLEFQFSIGSPPPSLGVRTPQTPSAISAVVFCALSSSFAHAHTPNTHHQNHYRPSFSSHPIFPFQSSSRVSSLLALISVYSTVTLVMVVVLRPWAWVRVWDLCALVGCVAKRQLQQEAAGRQKMLCLPQISQNQLIHTTSNICVPFSIVHYLNLHYFFYFFSFCVPSKTNFPINFLQFLFWKFFFYIFSHSKSAMLSSPRLITT